MRCWLSMLAYLDLKNVSNVEALDAVKRVIWGIEESRRFPVHRIVEYEGMFVSFLSYCLL